MDNAPSEPTPPGDIPRTELASFLLDALFDALPGVPVDVVAVEAGALVELSDGSRWLVDCRDPIDPTPTAGSQLIAAERERQTYSAGHDDDHDTGELAYRAAELLVAGTRASLSHPVEPPDFWGLVEGHPSAVQRLIVAGALVAAEIDRRLRLANPEQGS